MKTALQSPALTVGLAATTLRPGLTAAEVGTGTRFREVSNISRK